MTKKETRYKKKKKTLLTHNYGSRFVFQLHLQVTQGTGVSGQWVPYTGQSTTAHCGAKGNALQQDEQLTSVIPSMG